MNITGKPIYAKPEKQAKDPAHLAFVGSLPCVICNEYGIEQLSRTQVHHCIHGRYGSRKVSDAMTIPLCVDHHTGGDNSKIAIHLQPAAWKEAYGKDTRWISWVENRKSNAT